jgi:hypothetical protein
MKLFGNWLSFELPKPISIFEAGTFNFVTNPPVLAKLQIGRMETIKLLRQPERKISKKSSQPIMIMCRIIRISQIFQNIEI